MIFKSINNWKNPDRYPGMLFFAQRMDELSFEYSMDSNKAPTLNVPFLINEALSEIEISKKVGRPQYVVSHILDELSERLRNNLVVPSLLSLDLTYYLRSNEKTADDPESKLRVLNTELHPNRYLYQCYKLLEVAIAENKKIEINFLSREIVTTLQGLGVSSFEINSKVNEHFFGSKMVSSHSCLKDFFENFNPPRVREFEVALKIESRMHILRKDILEIFNFELVKQIPENFQNNCADELKNLTGSERILIARKVRAYDLFSAIELVHKNIDRLQDLYGLFNHKSTYNISESAQVRDLQSNEVSKERTTINSMHFVRDNKPHPAAKKLENMIEYLHLPRGEDADKFFRAIDFHGLGSKSGSVENQIINIWTALETFVPFEERGPIGSNVVKKILPLIGLQYFGRIFEQVTFDLERWDKDYLDETVAEVRGSEAHSNVESVLRLVALEEHDVTLKALYNRLGSFELLRFRLFELNKVFSSPKRTTKKLFDHQKLVEWQLHRVYRTRNAIVHSGQTQAFSKLLVSNAHDYFDQVFSLVSELCSGAGGFSNFRDGFNFAAWSYRDYETKLKNIKEIHEGTITHIIWKRNSSR